MSRAMFVTLDEAQVIARCNSEKVGISAIEALPQGGVRLVCMSGDDAVRMRKKFKAHLLPDSAVRQSHRPKTPMW